MLFNVVLWWWGALLLPPVDSKPAIVFVPPLSTRATRGKKKKRPPPMSSSTYNYLPIGAKLNVSVSGRRAIRPEGQTVLPSIFEFVSPKPRSIVLYSVCVTQLSPSRKDWVVERRYRDFNYLYEYLKKKSYDMKSYFPGKAFFTAFMQDFSEDVSVNFLQKREKSLNNWIKCLSLILKNCNGETREEIRKFLLPKALFVSLSTATLPLPTRRPESVSQSPSEDNSARDQGSPVLNDSTLTNILRRKTRRNAKSLDHTPSLVTRTPDSKRISLVACGAFIAEGLLECNKPFKLPINNKNDVCVIIFSDGCYTRFRYRLLLRRLKKSPFTSFPISHKGKTVGACYVSWLISWSITQTVDS